MLNSYPFFHRHAHLRPHLVGCGDHFLLQKAGAFVAAKARTHIPIPDVRTDRSLLQRGRLAAHAGGGKPMLIDGVLMP